MVSNLYGYYDLGVARASIIIDPSQVAAGIKQAQGDLTSGLGSFGNSVQALGSQISGVGLALSAMVAPVMLLGATGVQSVRGFQDVMSEVRARAQLSAQDMERLRTTVLGIGQASMFTGTQAAEGFLELVLAGQTAEEAFSTLPAVIDLAAASGLELGFVADSLTDIMAQYDLSVDDAVGITESLARGAGASSASVDTLIMGLRNSGGIAREFGMSIEETVATLSLFSDNGIKASEAGTQLRSMLRFMTRDTDEVRQTWERLGTDWKDAAGNIRPLEEIINDIRRGMEGMTEADRFETFRLLGGAFGQLGLQALVAGGDIGTMTSRMQDQASISEVVAARMDTLSGTIAYAKGSLEAFWVETLEPFVNNALRPFIRDFADFLNKMTNFAKDNPEVVETIIKLTIGLGALGTALMFGGRLITVFGAAISFIASPVGALVAGIAVLANLLQLDLASGFENIVMQASVFAQRIGEFGILGALRLLFIEFEDGSSAIESFLEALGVAPDTAQSVSDAINSVATVALNFVEDVINIATGFWSNFMVPFIASLEGPFNTLLFTFRYYFDMLVSVIDTYIGGDLQNFVNMFTSGQWGKLPEILSSLFQNLRQLFWDKLAGPIGRFLADNQEDIAAWTTSIIVGIAGVGLALTLANLPALFGLVIAALNPLTLAMLVGGGILYAYATNIYGVRDAINMLGDFLRGNSVIGLILQVNDALSRLTGAAPTTPGTRGFTTDDHGFSYTVGTGGKGSSPYAGYPVDQMPLVQYPVQQNPGPGTRDPNFNPLLPLTSGVSFVAGSGSSTVGGSGTPLPPVTGTAARNAGGALPTQFHNGGWTGDSRDEFGAMIKGREYVVPENGALVMRGGGDSGGSPTIIVNVDKSVVQPGLTPEEHGDRMGEAIYRKIRSRGPNNF